MSTTCCNGLRRVGKGGRGEKPSAQQHIVGSAEESREWRTPSDNHGGVIGAATKSCLFLGGPPQTAQSTLPAT
jgi:hypothetical protein